MGQSALPGYYYYIVGSGDQGDCFPDSIWSVKANSHRDRLEACRTGGPGPELSSNSGLAASATSGVTRFSTR